LVVEDDPSVATVTAEMLRILRYSAVVVSSIESARVAWRKARGAFDLVLIDFILVDGSGAVLAASFISEKPDLPCIMVSGLSEDNVDLPTGRVKYLAKPFTISQLRATIDALIPV
jgi:DNA-binding response OmpR family regulator